MTEDEMELMKRYDITAEQKSVYLYKGYKYEQLRDAVNYARIEDERQRAQGQPSI